MFTTFTTTPFRDASFGVAAETADLRRARLSELHRMPSGLASIFVRRTARIAFGVAGTLGAAGLAACVALRTGSYTYLLLAAWALAVAAYFGTASLATVHHTKRLRRMAGGRGEPFADAAALRALNPHMEARALDMRRGYASWGWPMVALSLLGPFTLQLIAALVWSRSMTLADFDGWMAWTAPLTTPVFLYAAVVAWQFPRTRTMYRHILIAGMIALVPGVFLLGIPSLIVMATALALVLVVWLPVGHMIDREAAALDPTTPTLG
jgi:hypothetical protein